MNRTWWKRASFIAASMLMLAVLVKMNGNISSFMQHIKEQDAVYTFVQVNRSDSEKAELLKQIKEEAEKLRVEPINARIDRVYKAIPGYNGLEVDIDATYELNVNTVRGAQLRFIYREVEPAVQLEDLGSYPIYKGNPEKRSVALMINVAWGNEYLDSILNTLKTEDVKATFFLDGSWLSKNKELALRIQQEGHEISNHAYSHPDMATLSRSEQQRQIVKTEQLLKEMNVNNQWFAPPSGSFNATTVQVAREQGLLTVLWTIDTIDWRNPSPEQVMARIKSNLEPGAMILMHPTTATEQTLPMMIQYMKEKGYIPGTVAHTLSSERLHDAVEGVDIF
ncbi:polysaccharide deacetylase family protein [Paenibacillus sp. FSL W7-1287]|uniref:polysaccharide deacetylase family protein n=1 Tax=Paenibacillus sp. FSL W7-1287 TaxID=2954538 RepID=UPI0030F6C72D